MNTLKHLILVLTGALLLSGCGIWNMLWPAEDTGLPPKTFGILNHFPAHPYLLKKRTLAAGDSAVEIESLSVKDLFTETVAAHLAGKGYKAQVVRDEAALASGNVDMMIEIVPRRVFKSDTVFACGFLDRKFFLGLMNQPAKSYVALQLILKRRNSSRVIITEHRERYSRLGEGMLPARWDVLDPEQQAAFEANLRENIIRTVELSLGEFKI